MSIKLLWVLLGFVCLASWASKRTHGDDPRRNEPRKRPRLDVIINHLDLDTLFLDACRFGTIQAFEALYTRHQAYFNLKSSTRLALRQLCVLEAINRRSMKLVNTLLQTNIAVIPVRFIYVCVASNNPNMLRLILNANKPIDEDMRGYTVEEMVLLAIENHNVDMIKLLRTIWPFISSFTMVEKATRTTRPAVLACILDHVKPANKQEALQRGLDCSYWNMATCHVRLILSSMETSPVYEPTIRLFKHLFVETFKLVSNPETLSPSAVTTLIETNYNLWTHLLTFALKTAIGLGKVELIIGLIDWNYKRPFPIPLPSIACELLSVASLTGAWETIYNAQVEKKVLYIGHFLRFVDERLVYHELDSFMNALDKAPELLKESWRISGPVRNRDRAVYKVLTEVANGNIKALLRFMEAHPFELGVIWYAWEKFFDPTRSDHFIRAISCAVNNVEHP